MAHAEPKVCDAILFSDGVVREEGTGKLSLIGCFQHYNVAKFPFQPPPLFVTVSITNLRPGVDRLSLVLRIENMQTGHVLSSASAEIEFKNPPALEDVFDIPFHFPRFQFPSAGLYKAVVLADNEPIGGRALPVRTVTAATRESS